MDNNILELDDKMLFIKFAYFSFTKAEVTWDSNCFFFSFMATWNIWSPNRRRFRVFFRFLNFFQLFVDQLNIFIETARYKFKFNNLINDIGIIQGIDQLHYDCIIQS